MPHTGTQVHRHAVKQNIQEQELRAGWGVGVFQDYAVHPSDSPANNESAVTFSNHTGAGGRGVWG